MLKKNKLCKVCIAITNNKTLLNKIYNTTHYMKHSKVPLAAVHEEYSDQFSYRALRSHVKNHQFMSEDDFNERHLRQMAKQAEKQILKRHIESTEVWDEVINQGMEKLQAGEISMKTADLLKAAKDKSDYEMKAKDQQLALAEMMWHFASGENNESRSYDRRVVEGKAVTDFDPAEEPAGHLGEGEDRPGGVYYPPTWDAIAPGTSPLSERNDPAKS